MLISFEGIDFSGKTTQVDILNKSLTSKGFECECFHFPDRSTRIGSLLDKYLKEEDELDDFVVHLAFSANRYEFRKKIEHALNNGKIVIIDRYNVSGFVYSIAKGLESFWCKSTDEYLPKPDVIFLLNLSPLTALQRHEDVRSNKCFERYDNEQFQEIVREEFLKLRKCSWVKTQYKVINADRVIAEISGEIENIVLKLINLSKERVKN